jgi:hypothetical protein
MTPSRPRISSPLDTVREQQPYYAPHRNMTYVIRDALRTTKSHLKTNKSTIPPPRAIRSRVRTMGQGCPLTGPSPRANPLMNHSSLPLVSGNPLSNIIPKSHDFFSCFLLPSPLTQGAFVASTETHSVHVRSAREGVSHRLHQPTLHLSWDSLVSQPFPNDFSDFPFSGEEVTRPCIRVWFRVWSRSQLLHDFSSPTLRV